MAHPPGTGERGRPTRGERGRPTRPASGEGNVTEIDRVFAGIANERSRRVLYSLTETEVGTIDALVEEVVEREVGLPAEMTSAERRERIRTDLVHTHLPRLADLEIVEYDPDDGTVDYGDPPPRFDEFLAVFRAIETRSGSELD